MVDTRPLQCGSLLALPKELIDCIYELLSPADIASFACTCTQIYHSIRDQLEVHQELTSAHSVLRFDDDGHLPQDFFKAALHDRRVGKYLRRFVLGRVPFSKDVATTVWSELQDSLEPLLVNVTIDHYWTLLPTLTALMMPAQDLELHYAPLMTAGVFCLSPNMRELVLSSALQHHREVFQMVITFARLLYGKRNSQCKILQEVRHLSLSYWHMPSMPISFLSLISIFALLPSLKIVFAKGCGHFRYQRVWQEVSWSDLRTASSNIQVLRLENCIIEFPELSHCLRVIRSLKEMVLVTESWLDTQGCLPSAIFAALHRYHSRSLERLTLGMESRRIVVKNQHFQSCVLKDFERLYHVQMIDFLFQCTCPGIHSHILEGEEFSDDDVWAVDVKEAKDQSPQNPRSQSSGLPKGENELSWYLEEILPVSVQQIEIYYQRLSPAGVDAMAKNLCTAKQNDLLCGVHELQIQYIGDEGFGILHDDNAYDAAKAMLEKYGVTTTLGSV